MQYRILEDNPNAQGGGCACHGDTGGDDQGPLYVLFPAQETASNISPHVVVCSRCILDAAREIRRLRQGKGEPLSTGQ